MKKTLQASQPVPPAPERGADRHPPEAVPWLNLEALARVEVSSEAPGHAIRAALTAADGLGWRAAGPGMQTVRVRFHRPQDLTCIRIAVAATREERTQELTVWASSHRGETHREVVRQQLTFSAAGAAGHRQDYRVALRAVEVLELRIVPDVTGARAIATLSEYRCA